MKKRTVNITHYDLDGAVSAAIVRYAIRVVGTDGYHQGPVRRYPAVYTTLPEMIFNTIEADSMEGHQLDLIITDLRIDTADLRKVLEDDRVNSLLYIDHHERDGEESLATLQYVYDNFDYRHAHRISASKQALIYFQGLGVQFSDKMIELAELADVYDEWRVENPRFENGAVQANELFWDLSFEGFLKKYSEGIPWNDDTRALLVPILKEKEKHFKEVEKVSSTLEFGKGFSAFINFHATGRWSNDCTLKYEADVYLILGKSTSSVITFSCRSRNKKIKVNEVAASVGAEYGGTGGGHHASAGFWVPAGTPLESILETFMETLENL